MKRATCNLVLALCAVAGAQESAPAGADNAKVEFHGAAWTQMGRVENSFVVPNANNDYEKNWLGNSGGLVAASTKIDDNWDGSFGLGTVMVHLARGTEGLSKIWYPFWIPFVSEAQLNYRTTGYADKGGLQITLGYFPYNYNPDVHNLGMYLLRGYVYPGTLISGNDFQGAPVSAFNKVFGAMGRYKIGGLSNDLILNSETDDKPMFDFSVADVLTWRAHASFELGLGVNFYRLLPQNSKATSPGKDCRSGDLGTYATQGQENPCFIIRHDTAGVAVDTVTGSLAGTKLMGRFRLDPKAWFGSPAYFGANDLVLYGEAAVIGVKDYPVFYDDIMRRIPVMVGFNFPGFNLFNLAVEVEYYATKNSGDNLGPNHGSWLPAINSQVSNQRDDWKWSVNASRVFFGHMVLLGQVANDHLRMGGFHNEATGVEAMRTPEDWYWAGKLAYFF